MFVAVAAAVSLMGRGLVLTGNMQAILPVDAALFLGFTVTLVWRYRRDARFYREIDGLVNQLEHPYQLHALMNRPASPGHAMVFDALRVMGAASANEVADAKNQAQQYREYIESRVHEVKAPLSAALLACERVLDPDRSLIRGDVNKALREVDQALWYARSENPRADYSIREVALVELVRTACRKEARGLIERGVLVDIAIDEAVSVRTDEKHIGFVLSQILTNAAKYGASKISFTAQVAKDQFGAQSVVLSVGDDGSGIPAADLPRVFERGFTGARGREAGSSTGMGLYIAATICRRIGVGLSAASDGATGTTVNLSFPRPPAALAEGAPFLLVSPGVDAFRACCGGWVRGTDPGSPEGIPRTFGSSEVGCAPVLRAWNPPIRCVWHCGSYRYSSDSERAAFRIGPESLLGPFTCDRPQCPQAKNLGNIEFVVPVCYSVSSGSFFCSMR